MPKMTGMVDAEQRPLLRLVLPDGNPILALVDTGFNGELWLTRSYAVACGIEIDDVFEQTGYLVGMRPTREGFGRLRILWFGSEKIAGVAIDLDSEHRTTAAGEPVALIGTGLLAPSTMTVNFEKQTLVLRQK